MIPNPKRDDAVFTLVLDMLTTHAESLARQRKWSVRCGGDQ
ncbi:hypothetical protein ACFYT3_14210 [Nocardia amikacinitolerans]|nr:hypothetical protein [Nocardia amikacinitolerans]